MRAWLDLRQWFDLDHGGGKLMVHDFILGVMVGAAAVLLFIQAFR